MVLLNGIKPVGDGIIMKGQILECWLPSHMQPHIPYDPMKLPVIPLKVEWGGNTWTWLRVCNTVTNRVTRYWSEKDWS